MYDKKKPNVKKARPSAGAKPARKKMSTLPPNAAERAAAQMLKGKPKKKK